MSDRQYKSSRRGGERPPRDEYDRRERQGGGGGGRERDRYRDRERERDRDRGDRHERVRDREEEPRDRDHRRYRSRSPRDRRERERDRDYHDRRDDRDRARGKGRDDGREKPVRGGEEPQEKERNRGRDQDHGREDRNGDLGARKGTWPIPSQSPSSAEVKGGGRKLVGCWKAGLLTPVSVSEKQSYAKDRDPRRSASPRGSGSPPRRSASPRGRFEDEDYQGLPTRSKQDKHDRPGAPLSFKVKSQEREDDVGRDSRSKGGFEEGAGSFDADPMEEDEGDEVEVEADDSMMAMMGFGGFGTTKDTKVRGNNAGGVRKEKKTEYRQYMNRVGGFNRPLSPSR